MKALCVLALILLPLLSPAQDERHWLAARAASADTVVVGQLDRIDYEYERDFPVEGEAWLQPLITYKANAPVAGVLVVRESGLGENKCYFPRMAPWDERPRYLLFLVERPQSGALRGHPEGCAIEILVTSSGAYAARWPQPAFGGAHGRGDDALQSLAEEMTFQGPRARIDASDMLVHQRRERAEREFMRLEDDILIPTRGIELTELRRLMQPGLENAHDTAQAGERLQELRERMLEMDGESESGESGG